MGSDNRKKKKRRVTLHGCRLYRLHDNEAVNPPADRELEQTTTRGGVQFPWDVLAGFFWVSPIHGPTKTGSYYNESGSISISLSLFISVLLLYGSAS